MTDEIFESRLRDLVKLQHPYSFRPLIEGTPASVLLLIGRRKDSPPVDFEILMTRRSESLQKHRGQYAFPGGMHDALDGEIGRPETAIRTALRETEEEVGIPHSDVSPIGPLPALWTPSGFQVTPIVAVLDKRIDSVNIRPNAAEIELWFWCKMSQLQSPGVHHLEDRTMTIEGREQTVPMDVFLVDNHRIWGATAAILKNFIGRWEKLG